MKRAIIFFASLLICIATMAQQQIKHTVAAGETLSSIAAKYGVTEASIKEANPTIKKYFYAGMELVIPSSPKQSYGGVKGNDTPAEIKTSVVASANANDGNHHQYNPTNYTDDSKAGKVVFANELTWGYVIPHLGDASDYIDAKFSCGMTAAFGARFYATENFYMEGLAGYKWLKTNSEVKSLSMETNSTMHYITVPLHLGVNIPSTGSVSLGLYAGTRLDIPVSSKQEERIHASKPTKRDLDVPFSAMIEGGINILTSDYVIRLQYGYSPSEKNKYSMISIGVCANL